jgi:hypothetical protein
MHIPFLLLSAATLAVGIAAARPARATAAAQVGKAAPLFTADSSQGKIVLADFQGKKYVLVAFYFKDFTGG